MYDRTREAMQLMEVIAEIDEPMVICGDFNGEPSEPLYNIILDEGFRSAYYGTDRDESEPEFTTYKYRESLESKCIDYIFLRGAKVCSVLSLPKSDEIGPNGLPNHIFPSDHLSLVAKLRFN